MQIDQQLKEISCSSQHMASLIERKHSSNKRIVKLIQEANSQWSVAKDFGCSQSAVFKRLVHIKKWDG